MEKFTLVSKNLFYCFDLIMFFFFIDESNEAWDFIDAPDVCIFCDRKVRRTKGKNQKLATSTSEDKLNQIIKILEKENQHGKIDRIQDVYTVSYHPNCFLDLNYKHLTIRSPRKSKPDSNWQVRRDLHSITFKKIQKEVQESVIQRREIRSMRDIYASYVAVFNDQQTKSKLDLSDTKYQSQHLLKKLFEAIPQLTKTVYKRRIYLRSNDLSADEILEKGFPETDLNTQIKAIAFSIRQKVMAMEKRKLPKHNIALKDVLNGECEIPEELKLLIESLLNGPNRSKNPNKPIRANSICSSIVFSITNGAVKPASCLHLGLAMLSITGSRKVVNILNRMGHAISYTVCEEIVTELAHGCSERGILPDGLLPNTPALHTHLAFDNYDRYHCEQINILKDYSKFLTIFIISSYVESVETNGKGTLHDTVGIVYQNIDKDAVEIASSTTLTSNSVDATLTGRRRRTYASPFNADLQPYNRRNTAAPCFFGKDPMIPDNLKLAYDLEILWMLNNAYSTINSKRWFAFNSERFIDRNPVQKIGYLPTLNMSPTSDSVVKVTLEMAQTVAKECGQKYICATFDLAIASKALQIQSESSPQFDNVFVILGAFHIELSYFKVSKI